jgi:hypothetical protein
MENTKNMGVLSKMEGVKRHSAKTQKLEGWLDKLIKELSVKVTA